MRVQCLLKSGTSRMRAVLEDERLRVGATVTLANSADPSRRWEVVEIGAYRPPPEPTNWMGGGMEIVYMP